ncbi:hypothetical protein GCM10028777_09350 [Angustibacter speluncae]
MTFFIFVNLLLGFIRLNKTSEEVEILKYLDIFNISIFCFIILFLYKSFYIYLKIINFNTNELNVIFVSLDKIIFNFNEYLELVLILFRNIFNITNEFLFSTYNILSEFNYIPLYYVYIASSICILI